jgi:hypothetical protein
MLHLMPTIPKLPTFDLSTLPFDLPTIDLADLADLPRPELPTLEQVSAAARDAAYVGVGLAVMGVERLQAAGATLTDLLTSRVEQARRAVGV